MFALRRHQALNTTIHQDRIEKAILPAYEDMLSSLCLDSAKISKMEYSFPAFTEKNYEKEYKWNRHRLRRQNGMPKVKRLSTWQHRRVSVRLTSV